MDKSIEDQTEQAERIIEEISESNRSTQAQLIQVLMNLEARYKDLSEVQAALADENEALKRDNDSLAAAKESLQKELDDALEANKAITLENEEISANRDEWKAAFERVREGLAKLQQPKTHTQQPNVIDMKRVTFVADPAVGKPPRVMSGSE